MRVTAAGRLRLGERESEQRPTTSKIRTRAFPESDHTVRQAAGRGCGRPLAVERERPAPRILHDVATRKRASGPGDPCVPSERCRWRRIPGLRGLGPAEHAWSMRPVRVGLAYAWISRRREHARLLEPLAPPGSEAALSSRAALRRYPTLMTLAAEGIPAPSSRKSMYAPGGATLLFGGSVTVSWFAFVPVIASPT